MYDEKRNFYVCSFGGCGSWMLCHYLKNFGHVHHIHSRYPPKILTYAVKVDRCQDKIFGDVVIPPSDFKNYNVIYIYRNPIHAIYSRFQNSEHLKHIGSNPTVTLNHVLRSNQDLYGIRHFYDNYKEPMRNYKILFVKYEDLFHNVETFNKILRIPDIKELYMVKSEQGRDYPAYLQLSSIYKNLLGEMKQNKPFMLV
jgi:hypothetical protein